jgi:shikimate kinase
MLFVICGSQANNVEGVDKSFQAMRLSLIGMAGSGKSYWSMKLVEHGFRRFCCDDLIAAKLNPELTRPDGTTMELGEWMGFPYEPHYRERESKYLTCEIEVLAEILDYLESRKDDPAEKVIVDTTGSVIYTGEGILRSLCRYTRVIYLSIAPEAREQLLKAYISNPHPMLWRNAFSKEPGETEQEALTRCYPRLVVSRERLYEHYAHVTIDYYRRTEEGFGVSDLLHEVSPAL